MDCEYGHPYFTKASSPLKPRFATCGQDRHKGGDVQAMVSAMCEHLLEGESNRMAEQQHKHDKAVKTPREFTYDRGLQCDGGYTMYTPVHSGPDGNISQCTKAYNVHSGPDGNISQYTNAYNAEFLNYEHRCPHEFTDWQKKECPHRLGRCWCPKVSGDGVENTCHYAYRHSFHPYEVPPKGTSSLEQRIMSYGEHPVQWKGARRKKRQDKKVTKRKPKYHREYNQTFPSEDNDVNTEWRRLMLANQPNGRQLGVEVGCDLISSTAPILSKGTKEWIQEMLDFESQSERKRNREKESVVSLCNSGQKDWSRDWKASKLSRNVLYEMCKGAGHDKDEVESADFSDGELQKNITHETTSTAWEEVPKISNRNLSRTSANTDWLRGQKNNDNADGYVEIESGNIQYSNSMRYPTKKRTSRYISHCGASRASKTTNKATNRGQVPDQAREPWKCTVWDDKIPSQTGQDHTWSCELYSRTNLCEHDVGMACTDHYRSYIDARKHQKAMNDFGCQENLPDDRTLKLVNSAITQTEEECLETAAGTSKQIAKFEKISGNCTGQIALPKPGNDLNATKFTSPKIQMCEQKHVKSVTKPVSQTQNKTTGFVNQNTANIECDRSNNDNLKLTSVTPSPSAQTIKVVNLLKPVADPSGDKSKFIPNILTASDTKTPEIQSLVGNAVYTNIGHVSKMTEEQACRSTPSNLEGTVQEASRQENIDIKENENNTSVFMDGRGEESVVTSKTIQEVINKSYDKISPYEHDLGEQTIKWCSRQVCSDAQSCVQSKPDGKNKRTQKMLIHGGTKKEEMQEYERYKEGRKKYEEELSQKGCEFEIEPLKFQKQVSYQPIEQENTRESFENVTGDSLDICQLNRVRFLNENIQLVGSSGSLMSSPMSTSNQCEEDDEIKTDECLSYQEKKCYKKGAPPPGDRYDMVPCLTCSRSTLQSPRSLSSRQRNSRNKSLGRKKGGERRKNMKSARKRSSMSPRKSSYSTSDSSSDGTPVKKGKKTLKKTRNQGRKSVQNNHTNIERSYSRKVPELISSDLSSSRSSSSGRYNATKRNVKSKDPERSTVEAFNHKENTLYCNIVSPREDTTLPKSLRSEVKRKFNVTSPELLNYSSREDPKTYGKNYESSPLSFSYGDSGPVKVKQSTKKRGVNHPKSDPFSSLNTAELNLSIIKLYTEIQKLQQQLELNRDESNTPSRYERSVNNSPSSGSADKTLACSSRCQSLPDNTMCNSLNVTPKEMSYTTNQSASTDWTKSSKTHTAEETAQKLCKVYQKHCQVPYPLELQENGASSIVCRSDSPEKIPKKKGIPRDTSLKRVSKPLCTKRALPCVKQLRQSNNHTRANRKHISPSPSNGPTDQCSSCSEVDNRKDECMGDSKYVTNRNRLGTNKEGVPVASNGVKYTQTKESLRMDREKNVDAPQKDSRVSDDFPNNFTEEMQKHIASKMEYSCFEDDLHLHLTSAMSDRNITGEAQRGEAFNYSVTGNDDLRSARSYVCSSSWLSSNNQTENGDALGDCSNLVSPDEKSDAVCVRRQGQVNLLTGKHTGDGNNSKLDEIEALGEYNSRHEHKIPTSMTCRKLKIFGASREQTLRFYNSSVLNNSQNVSGWGGLTRSPSDTNEAQKVFREESSRGEFTTTQNKPSENPTKHSERKPAPDNDSLVVQPSYDVDCSVDTRAARDYKHAESRGSLSPVTGDLGGSSRWSQSKKLKIPYTVPQRKGRSSSNAKGTETFSNVERGNTSSNEIDSNRQPLATKDNDTDPMFHESGCDPKRGKCPTRYFAKPGVHRVNIESPVEKIIELLTEKPVRSKSPKPAPGTRSEKDYRFEEGLKYRKSNSPDANKRKVFQPNESYSEFERSPRDGRYSPVSLSKFFQENVQHIADYIQSFRENDTFDKNEVGKNLPGKNPSYDLQDHWVHPHHKYVSGISSNNVYGQCQTEEPIGLRRTYRENRSAQDMESGEYNRRSKAGQHFSNQQDNDFGKKRIASTPPNSPRAENNTLWADSSGPLQEMYSTGNSQTKMTHLQSEINDLFMCNEQCRFHESVQAQKNNSSLAPQSAVTNTRCEEFATRSRILLDEDNISSPYLAMVTENNNSNQGSNSPNYNNPPERPSTSSFSSTRPSSRTSKPEKANGGEFAPERVSYISYKKIKSQPKPGTLNNPHVHSDMNMDGLDSLKTLNLVGCVKEIFFKSFKPELGAGPKDQGDHACPPKPRAWPRSKPTVKPGDAGKTFEAPNGSVNKKLEETILCEYIAGRKPKHLHGENPTTLSERKPAPDNDLSVVQPSYVTSQRHGAQGDSAREARLPPEPGLPSKETMGNTVRRHDDGHLRANFLGDNKNPMLPYTKVKICSPDKCCTLAYTMPAHSKWKGDNHHPKTCHYLTLTADSNKAIPHYSDAIRTGSWRSRTSVLPLREAFSDFCGDREDAKKYSSVKNAYTRDKATIDESQNEGGLSQEKCLVPTYPKQEDLVSKGEGSILSSFEKMMQDKRPCFAEHCQLQVSDSKIDGAKRRNTFGQSLRHPRSNPATPADDNNSSNETVDDEKSPPCLNVPTSRIASAYQNRLDIGATNCTDHNVQDCSTLNTPRRKVHYVNGGSANLTNPWSDLDYSKMDTEHFGDCEEGLLNVSLDLTEHNKECGLQRFVLENCSDVLFRQYEDESKVTEDHSSGDGNAAWENMLSRGPVCEENDVLGLQHNQIDLSLNITQDDEDIFDNGNYSDEEGKAGDGRGKDDARENCNSCHNVLGAGESVASNLNDEEKLVKSKSEIDVRGDDGVCEERNVAGDVSDDASSDSDADSTCGSVVSSQATVSESCDSRCSSESDAESQDSSVDE